MLRNYGKLVLSGRTVLIILPAIDIKDGNCVPFFRAIFPPWKRWRKITCSSQII
jgi:hypothetical protein